ncbi:MAG: Bsp6I family type II restriction endonuclease [Armatimonadetes bacterium]|nr:Bsp6I family type II restriction endonuclease [Armatimonadota bacterium]
MSKERTVVWKGQRWGNCVEYEAADEPGTLDVLFFWKTAVLLAEQTGSKKPQLPETFSEPFVCLICGLVRKPGKGPDAFSVASRGTARAAVEIKATITATGFTDAKRDLQFDELYWLSMPDYRNLRFSIYRFTRADLEQVVRQSRTRRERGTVGLAKVAAELGKKPFKEGRIGCLL